MICNIICKQFGFFVVDNRLMQVITYHCLAIGFAAMTLKTEKSTHKTNKAQVLEFGALQGGTYMLQAFVGIGITVLMFLFTRHGEKIVSYIYGLILPLAFGPMFLPLILQATAPSVFPWHPSASLLHLFSVYCI